MTRGLANMGNTCSINTMIQCLGHSTILREYVLDHSIFTKKEQRIFSIGEELALIWKQLWVDENSLKPVRFLRALQETLGSGFQIGSDQMDFTEVWMLLVNELLEESHALEFQSKFFKTNPYTHKTLHYIDTMAKKQWTLHAKHTNSPLLDLIQGMQVQQIECMHCHKLYHNLEPFQFTYLDVATSLEESFQKFFKTDVAEGWACDQCHEHTNQKHMRFWKLPTVWVIILKRFDGMQKNHSGIHIPLEFSFPIGFEMCQSTKDRYQLVSIANHYGSLHGGHYNAICKNKEQWYMYDDLSIQPISTIASVLQDNRHAYALIYERVSL